MTQTTAHQPLATPWLALSADGVTYTYGGGSLTSIVPSGGGRSTGETHTADGETPIVTAGKRAATSVNVKIVASTEDAEIFEVARGIMKTEGGATYLQWRIGTSGKVYKMLPGVMESFLDPGGDVGPGAALGGFVVKCSDTTSADAST